MIRLEGLCPFLSKLLATSTHWLVRFNPFWHD